MLAAFEGQVVDGKLVIEELGREMRILEGKHLAVTSLTLNDENKVVGGELKAGTYENGDLITVEGDTLKDFEGKKVLVAIRHELFGRHAAFDEKYQLGSKIGDVDT
jgi:hypothetical protein